MNAHSLDHRPDLSRLAVLTIVACCCFAPFAINGIEPQIANPAGVSTAGIIPSPEPDWPQFRGPRRDGICDETGLMQAWPPQGPKLLWTSTNLGYGYSAPILSGNRLFITGDAGENLVVFALGLDGHVLWRATNGACWKNPYPGARALCTIHNGRLFNMNAHGRLACFDPATGREIWNVNVLERFGGQNITWAMSECVLVDDDRVIVTPGGSTALMAALDVKTGNTIWATEPLMLGGSPSAQHQRMMGATGTNDGASYASPLLVAWGGHRLLVSCSTRHVFGVDADTGKLLWTRPFPTRYLVIAATPVWCGDGFFITAPDTENGGKRFRFVHRRDTLDVEEVWSTPLDTCHGGIIKIDNWLFGSWYRRDKGWACVDVQTGKVAYQARDWPMGSVLYADKRLYGLTQEGEVLLLQPTATKIAVHGYFRLVPNRVSDAWAHPVIQRGNLYLRYHNQLFCYDVRAH